MSRTVTIGLALALSLFRVSTIQAQSASVPAPLTYEVQINGENFLVESNRVVKLDSKKKPDTHYTVAVRVSPTQQMRLNTIEFDYELPAKVTENGGRRENRSVRLEHELGFSVLLTDLGKQNDAKTAEGTLKMLTDSVVAALHDEKAIDINTTESHERTFAHASARGATIRYKDAKDFHHVCLVYVLSGPSFSASCVVEYLENDADDVLPLIKKTLDSIRGVSARR